MNAQPKGQLNAAAAKAAEIGVHALSPHLICAGAADAIAFYKKAFDAEELMVLPGPDGRLLHACLRINGSSVMLVDEMPEHGALGPKSRKGSSVTLHLIVEDADAAIDKAVAAGARVVMPAADMFWGDRYGIVEDPFGHAWSFATPKRQPSPEEIQRAVSQFDAGACATEMGAAS